jgi:hypothetical protein
MERVFPHGVIGASYAGWESTKYSKYLLNIDFFILIFKF